MKKLNIIAMMVLAATAVALSSCSDGKSYAQLLNEEDMYTNNFLADNIVVLSIPEDTVFESLLDNPNAPYYRLDEDGMLYMQVINPGTEGNMVESDEQIYFRYTRWPLATYSNGTLYNGEGNNITLSPVWFRYGNFQIQTSYNWGQGVQIPLNYLPVDCEVNLVIKSQMGPVDETANVQPFLWRLTYERRQ